MNPIGLAATLPVPTLLLSVAAMLLLGVGAWVRPSTLRKDARIELLISLSSVLVVALCAVWAFVGWVQGVVPEPHALFTFDALAAVSTLFVAAAAA
ncbi:MAG: hypothetical protein VCC04_08590, partial [Myxococcota bacterium]